MQFVRGSGDWPAPKNDLYSIRSLNNETKHFNMNVSMRNVFETNPFGIIAKNEKERPNSASKKKKSASQTLVWFHV